MTVSSMDALARVVSLSTASSVRSHTQQVVLDLVAAVHNLRDQEDVQLLVLLADELGVLRPNPFYFSVQGSGSALLPCSLVLRDTVRTLLESGSIGWEHGNLCVFAYGEPPVVDSRLAWLAALAPIERRALVQAAIALRAHGVTVCAPVARAPLRQVLDQSLGEQAASSLLGQLQAVSWQV